ncbi:metal-binding protein [Streptomyces palmae]|uniref:metal-binding protein n=1 Tax=Streptomyces palmae TaxID=1701085 RepID=UPI0035EE99BC
MGESAAGTEPGEARQAGRTATSGGRAAGRTARRGVSLTADEQASRSAGGAEPARTDTPAPRSGQASGGRGGSAARSAAGARDAAGGRASTPGTASGGRAGGREARGEESRPGTLTVGAARAGALLERQLTLARTRAHTAALQALGSSRFHAVADSVALLASEVPLDPATAARPADPLLPQLAELAERRLAEAVDALPLGRAGHPYNAEALVHGLAATPAADAPPASEQQDAPWHQVRRLVRMRRYALEVLDTGHWAPGGPLDGEPALTVRLLAAGQALERHRDAAEAAAAAAAAARTPRIAPATAYALGVLHADQRHEVEAARFAFGQVWQRLAAPAR